MPFEAPEEYLQSWDDLLKCLDELKRGWLFRGALAHWNLESSFERACRHWNIPELERPRVEQNVLREFKRHPDVKGLVAVEDDDLEWFALMQHYGAPTRLLDWSYSPFPALFFALDRLFDCDPKEKCKKAALWAIRQEWFTEKVEVQGVLSRHTRKKLNKYQSKRDAASFRELFVQPKQRAAFVYPVNPMHLNDRLSVQKGAFLCQGDISQSFEDNLKRLGALDDPANARSFIVSSDLLPRFFDELHWMNVSARSLYPGLSGYAQWLKHRLPRLPDVP